MKKYVIIDSTSNIVKSIVQWADIPMVETIEVDGEMKEQIVLKEVEFPSNWVFNENETVVPCNEDTVVDLADVYHPSTNEFFVLDVSDTELEIADLEKQLAELNEVLSDFQEATWTALGVDETKLPLIWQDRLNNKRQIRARLTELGA